MSYNTNYIRKNVYKLEDILNSFWNDSTYETYKSDVNDQYEFVLAGYSKDDVSIEHVDDVLHIVANNEKRGEKVYKLYITNSKDVESAKLDDGILSIKLKTKPEKSKKILIE